LGGAIVGATLGFGAEVAAGYFGGAAATTAAAASSPFAYRAVQWIQLSNTGKIGHIMDAKHCWDLIAKSFDEVQAIMQRVIQSVDMVATGIVTESGAPKFHFISQVQGYNVWLKLTMMFKKLFG
jgi:hypothetical protein